MATVVPGYVFSGPTDPITYTKLNLLGSPTISIGAGEITIANLAPMPGTGYYVGSTALSATAAAIRVNDTGVDLANTTIGFSVGATSQDSAIGLGQSGSAKSYWKWVIAGSASDSYAQFVSTGNIVMRAGGAKTLSLGAGGLAGLSAVLCDEQSNAVVGSENTDTARTTGFPYVPTVAGNPSGTPAVSYSGFVPMVIDSTSTRVYFRISGTWRYAALT